MDVIQDEGKDYRVIPATISDCTLLAEILT